MIIFKYFHFWTQQNVAFLLEKAKIPLLYGLNTFRFQFRLKLQPNGAICRKLFHQMNIFLKAKLKLTYCDVYLHMCWNLPHLRADSIDWPNYKANGRSFKHHSQYSKFNLWPCGMERECILLFDWRFISNKS